MNNLIWVEIVGVLWVLTIAYECVKGWRKGRLKYALKGNVNSMRWVVHLIGSLYIVIGSVSAVPAITEFANGLVASQTDELGIVMIRLMPFAFVVALFWVMVWFMGKGFQPWLKYTDSEKLWAKQEKERWLGKLPRVLQRILR